MLSRIVGRRNRGLLIEQFPPRTEAETWEGQSCVDDVNGGARFNGLSVGLVNSLFSPHVMMGCELIVVYVGVKLEHLKGRTKQG